MGKIKRFVTKPRDCDAFATLAPSPSAEAGLRSVSRGTVSESDAESDHVAPRRNLRGTVTGTARGGRSGAERSLRLVRLSRLRPRRFDVATGPERVSQPDPARLLSRSEHHPGRRLLLS